MKRLLMVSALLLTQACVYQQGDAGVRLLGVKPMLGATADDCEVGTDDLLIGTYDVSGGENYRIGLSYESLLVDPEPLDLGDRVVPPEARDIIIEELVFRYEAEGLTLPGEEVIPVYFVIRPNASADSTLRGVPLLTETARSALLALPANLKTPVATVFVSMQLRGHMTSGSIVTSNAINFPLNVYNTGYSPATGCAAGGTLTAADKFPCSRLGQEGLVCR